MTAFECIENIGSYDPNDKRIYVDGFADGEIIAEDSKIEYLIRFQNTGTDTAFTVRVEDSLSSDFDWSSAVPVSASHDYSFSIDNNNLIIQFDNILLVDSLTNEEDSHGFIKFIVDLDGTRPEPGALVENTAEIYFDFNDPIVTNTVQASYLCQHSRSLVEATICFGEEYEGYTESGTYQDMLVTALGCDSLRTLELNVLTDADCQTSTSDLAGGQLTIYPIPAQNNLNISYVGNKQVSSYKIFDFNGQEIARGAADNLFSIQIDEILSGIYIMQLNFGDDSVVNRRISLVR